MEASLIGLVILSAAFLILYCVILLLIDTKYLLHCHFPFRNGTGQVLGKKLDQVGYWDPVRVCIQLGND